MKRIPGPTSDRRPPAPPRHRVPKSLGRLTSRPTSALTGETSTPRWATETPIAPGDKFPNGRRMSRGAGLRRTEFKIGGHDTKPWLPLCPPILNSVRLSPLHRDNRRGLPRLGLKHDSIAFRRIADARVGHEDKVVRDNRVQVRSLDDRARRSRGAARRPRTAARRVASRWC